MDHEELLGLAIRAGLARKCGAPNCENVIATGEDDEELIEWLQDHDLDDAADLADALCELAVSLPNECNCELSKKLLAPARRPQKAQWMAR